MFGACRTEDTLHEVHLVSFESQEGYELYLADEERQSRRSLLDGLDVDQPVLRMNDVKSRSTIPERARHSGATRILVGCSGMPRNQEER